MALPNQYRSDIDGLRTIAVLSVLLFHARIAGFAGGFTGVDVFFVISGYLITGKIEGEISRGTFTFSSFYLGRARRLLPALFVTIAVTLLFAALVLAPNHFNLLGQSTIWAAIPFSNVYFYLTAGYWDVENALKPLLHTWSLSVEEQFYFVWPLALFALSRFRWWAAPAALAVAGALSFAGTLLFIKSVTATFYLPWFRVFEFALGALLVWSKPAPARLRMPLSLVGLALVLHPVFKFHADVPTQRMIVPAAGAALLIYAGPTLVARLWNNPVGVYVGKISYSIYLMHWPLIVLYSYWRFVAITAIESLALCLAAILLAMPLHHFVEQKFRYPKPERRRAIPWSIVAASACLVCVGSSMATREWPSAAADASPDPDIIADFTRPPCENGAGLCGGDHPDVVMFGDSHSASWAPAIAKTLRDMGLRGSAYDFLEACPFILGLYPVNVASEKSPCPARRAEWLARLEKDNPRLIILPGFWENGLGKGLGGLYTDDGKSTRDMSVQVARELFAKHMRSTVETLVSTGRKVIVLNSGPYVDRSPSICFGRRTGFTARDCLRLIQINDPDAVSFIRNTMRAIAADNPSTFYLDGFSHLCSPTEGCTFGDGMSFYDDRHHLSRYGALWFQKHAFGEMIQFIAKSVPPAADVKQR